MKTKLLFITMLIVISIGAYGQISRSKKYKELIKVANKGNVEAQYNLGEYCYSNFRREEATKWYLKAAEQGHAKAQTKLADCYWNGDGITKNHSLASYWYNKAVELGNEEAMDWLGWRYYFGSDGYPKDLNKSLYWCKKAAEKGNPESQWFLGMYYLGDFSDKEINYELAVYWLQKAVEQDATDPRFKDDLERAEKKLRESNKLLAKADLGDTNIQHSSEVQSIKTLASSPTEAKPAPKPQPAATPKPQPVATPQPQPAATPKQQAPDVDRNIFVSNTTDKNTYAVIIGNEKYKHEAGVPFAENDASIMKNYVQKTLGVPEKQIKLIENAGYNDIRIAVNWLTQAMKVCRGKGKAIFYYAGHGIPNEEDHSAYLLPTDGIGNDPASAYSLKELYDKLGNMDAQSVTIFLDACFSGSKREQGMLASARGVAIKAKPTEAKGNMVVFSAATGDETAYPYQSQQHGMFTYYLLKKLQDTKGNVTLGELSDYLSEEVGRQSFVENNKMQTPTVIPSAALAASWRSMKLKTLQKFGD